MGSVATDKQNVRFARQGPFLPLHSSHQTKTAQGAGARRRSPFWTSPFFHCLLFTIRLHTCLSVYLHIHMDVYMSVCLLWRRICLSPLQVLKAE